MEIYSEKSSGARKLDKTLNEIKNAEKKAEEIINNAHKKAEATIAKAKEDSMNILNDKKQELITHEKEQLNTKRKGLESLKADIMRNSKKDALELEQKAGKNHKKAVDSVVKAFKETINK